jgi:TRAP-type C4-dicarboxylate transport system substrate-binding protein
MTRAGIANAEGATRLRMAAVAPDGTAWAREIHALSRDVEALTRGSLTLKWYFGGIAGDELQVLDRIERGQLDGTAGATFCERLAPSLRVTRMVGMFQNRNEVRFVMGRLRELLEHEFEKSGYVALGFASFGTDILFTRTPVANLEDLRKSRMWTWDTDQPMALFLKEMGVPSVPAPITEAARLYDEGKLDGFLAVPAGALVFQWSTRARYFSEVPMGLLPGCFAVSKRAFNALTRDQQQALRTAVAKFSVRFEDVGAAQDEALLGGLFEKQGLHKVQVTSLFRAQLFEAAQGARKRLGDQLVSSPLLSQVLAWLADYRAEHAKP